MLLLTTNTGWARTITVVSYNVQNLFDATDDGGEYRQFTRAGGWTSELYTAKLRAIGSALRAAEPGGADLVALQEVEHYDAARRLVDQELDGLGYRHVVWLPDPHNATGPVVLSKLPVRRVGALWVDSGPVDRPDDGLEDGLDPLLRPILEVEVALADDAAAAVTVPVQQPLEIETGRRRGDRGVPATRGGAAGGAAGRDQRGRSGGGDSRRRRPERSN